MKTHCKVALVVRRDEDNVIRRYVHLATGNYNPQTARDLHRPRVSSPCNPEFADDVSALFNYLTGYAELPQWRKLLVAPSRLQTVMIEKIDREAANQRAGKPARLLVKVNGILEPAVVKALYRASQAGVKIDIACRGICSLRPGIAGRQREHPRGLGRGPLPRAQPHLLLRERGQPGGVRRQRGLDGPQPEPARRGGLPGRAARPRSSA